MSGMISPKHIAVALHEEARFVESLGLEVSHLPDLLHHHNDPVDPDTIKTIEMLVPFQNTLESLRTEQGLLSFHQVFETLSLDTPTKTSTDNHLHHLLVDEFQDISPEIVKWLKTVLHKYSGKASIMAVGDDWQSIYGWRGSDPNYIIKFRNHFSTPDCQPIYLEDNFRSRQPIINSAEVLLEKVTQKTNKKGKSHILHIEESLSHPIRLATYTDLANTGISKVIEDLGNFIFLVLSEFTQQDLTKTFIKQNRIEIKVLSRDNSTLEKYKASKKIIMSTLSSITELKINIDMCTFHGAKGLESDFTLLLRDCFPPDRYPFRDFLYECINHPLRSYTKAQEEEAYRLAYVAITRARYGVMWAIEQNSTRPEGAFAIVSQYANRTKEDSTRLPAGPYNPA